MDRFLPISHTINAVELTAFHVLCVLCPSAKKRQEHLESTVTGCFVNYIGTQFNLWLRS